jgi:hypothetical protein
VIINAEEQDKCQMLGECVSTTKNLQTCNRLPIIQSIYTVDNFYSVAA